jgi:hypothetical protein
MLQQQQQQGFQAFSFLSFSGKERKEVWKRREKS